MEVYMTNISHFVTSEDLKAKLAHIFHSPNYANGSVLPLNFNVHIFPSRKRMPTVTGTLTVPHEQIGLQFLEEYGGITPSQSIVIGTRIRFQRSRKEPRNDILEEVRRLPYVDPIALKGREERAKAIGSSAVFLKGIQFGWICQDNVFSVEWEHHFDQAQMGFDMDRREFRIKAEEEEGTRIVAIRVPHIYWASAAMDGARLPIILLWQNWPPSFEFEDTTASFLPLDELYRSLEIRERPPRRRKLSAFNQDHEPYAPYTSLVMRLICWNSEDLAAFRFISENAHLSLADYCYPIEYRGLFNEDIRLMYDSWVSNLPWVVAFQVDAIARSRAVTMKDLIDLREEVQVLLKTRGEEFTALFMREFYSQAMAHYWYQEVGEDGSASLQSLFADALQGYLAKPVLRTLEARETFECFRLVVTPTTWFLEGPFPERFNRVIRSYRDHQDSFLRVNFVDENRLQYRFDREVDGSDFVRRRVKGLLTEGVTIAGRKFRFLAYSQSALKEHAVWFVKEFIDSTGSRVDASTIIRGLGDFRVAYDPKLIYCPARYAARISQAFTSTDASISVEAEEIIIEEDIEDGQGRSFTDGVGTISRELARAIWKELWSRRHRNRRAPTHPRAFQIRFGGSKGMLSVDHTLKGRIICPRRSMIKFEAPHSTLIEVARAFDRPGKYYLNRPLIMLLEGLGVPYEVFQELQDDAVRHVEDSRDSLENAARLLETHGLGSSFRLTSIMLNLHKLGVEPLMQDVFWRQMMDFAVNHVLRELKHHARIPVPNGWTLVGVADVHRFLEEGEIFACVMPSEGAEPIYLEGPTLISRSPTIHPGDVQVVRAIGNPPANSPFAKESLRNTVVFSVKGQRPLPSCLGGGDLDGDVYNLTTMPKLRPRDTHAAASYAAAVKKLLNRPCTMDDVADFVAEYIISDTLGIIAINWLIIADQSPQGILDPDCLKLAELHSDAVDYPKSGLPVPVWQIPRLRFRVKPDWNAPETVRSDTANFYESQRAIGKLFRAISLPALRTVRQAARFQRRRMENGQWRMLDDVLEEIRSEGPREDNKVRLVVQLRVSEFIRLDLSDEAEIARLWELFDIYASRLRGICADYTLSRSRDAMLTEEEAVIGTIVAQCAQPRQRKDSMSKMREQTAELVNSVRLEIAEDEDIRAEQLLSRAWIAYRLADLEGDTFGARSFGWIALSVIFDAIKEIEEDEGYRS
ncbi:RdRP-domain-containing protein [Obba rivulosa]|uniref:RNA-dependent RNA polymerase n=1 Tax=Obba rivulosa TaxID=1052685 RepID=A0A8E2DVM6_9APHY|nr:RdRP-domain-containing protein [Obba rivulosa]